MAATYDYEWNQGEDLTISLVYKSGPLGAEVPVDLTLYALRMDISSPNGSVLSVLNDEAITDTNPFLTGNQGDTSYEVTMGSAGQIAIDLSRNLTLPSGAFFKYINANPPTLTFDYDIFLRDPANKQKKIIYGQIQIVKSVTKWQ